MVSRGRLDCEIGDPIVPIYEALPLLSVTHPLNDAPTPVPPRREALPSEKRPKVQTTANGLI